jgi:hypothetical protein
MKKNLFKGLAVLSVLFAVLLAGNAWADGHGHHGPPRHGYHHGPHHIHHYGPPVRVHHYYAPPPPVVVGRTYYVPAPAPVVVVPPPAPVYVAPPPPPVPGFAFSATINEPGFSLGIAAGR